MSTDLIAYVLGQDYKRNRTAAQVRARLPNQWAADIDVPIFLYQPLSEILLGLYGDSTAQEALQELIIPVYGLGDTPDQLCIQLIDVPFESVEKADGMKSDQVGAETALLKTLIQIGENLSEADGQIAKQADLRMRLVLDVNARSAARRGTGAESFPQGNGLPSNGDPTIRKDFPVICNFLGVIDNETAQGKVSLYRLQYNRAIV